MGLRGGIGVLIGVLGGYGVPKGWGSGWFGGVQCLYRVTGGAQRVYRVIGGLTDPIEVFGGVLRGSETL